jgi:hypothetical protein
MKTIDSGRSAFDAMKVEFETKPGKKFDIPSIDDVHVLAAAKKAGIPAGESVGFTIYNAKGKEEAWGDT